MNIVIGIILFLLGFIIGVFTRNILIRIVNINNKIKRAEQIIAEEETLKKNMIFQIALMIKSKNELDNLLKKVSSI
ncbi:MAG: hypothetical protein PHD15_06645 [Clostridia bacterium]|nr:hypothetical protein [Clostridia bacterium]